MQNALQNMKIVKIKKNTSLNLNLVQELEITEVISRSYYKCVCISSIASIYRLLMVRESFHIKSK